VKAAAVASDLAADAAANRVLADGGTAADAVVAGFLVAGAVRPGALFSPVQGLFAGPGAGARAFDGRARQPGRGVPRPRGVAKADEIPDAALVAVPASLGALALLHAYGGYLSLQRLVAPALEHARAVGADGRSEVIAKFAQRGPAALTEAAILRPLLAAASRTQGGLLSEEDLVEVRPESAAPRQTECGLGRRALVVPWPAPEAPQRETEFVVAADASGVMAALSYAPDDDGLAVSELGLTLPRDAVVVRRGIPRVTPGEPLPCPAPITIGLDDHAAFLALGVRSRTPFDAEILSQAWSDRTATAAQLLASANVAARGMSARGVVRSRPTEQVQKVSV
jgi:gamma-glutamyltranspeptidase/glutathione hydrolase